MSSCESSFPLLPPSGQEFNDEQWEAFKADARMIAPVLLEINFDIEGE